MANSNSTMRKKLFDEQNGQCAYCDIQLENSDEGTIDHVLPKSVFPNVKLNKVFACKPCNNKKGNIHLKINKRSRLSEETIMKIVRLQIFMLEEIGWLNEHR